MIYLDNAATSFPKPDGVIAAMTSFMRDTCANPGRAGHRMAIETARRVFGARETVAEFFGASDSSRVIFTQNITMALNMVIRGFLRPGDRVLATSMEHNSVMRPLRRMEREQGINVDIARGDADGLIDPDSMAALVRPDTRLIIINHGSNVNGALQDAEAIMRKTRERNPAAAILLDTAQTAGVIPVSLDSLPADFLAFTGHKGLLGPQGTGGLILRKGIDPEPLMTGGTGSRSEHELQPDFAPDRYESGTLNNPGIIGLAEGIRHITRMGLAAVRERELTLAERLIAGLREIRGCSVQDNLPPERRIAVVSFTFGGIPCDAVGQYLNDAHDIMIRTGLHCAPAAHRTLGTFPDGSARVSPGCFTAREEIDAFLSALKGWRGRPG
jgi:cysteine desulfurase family protein